MRFLLTLFLFASLSAHAIEITVVVGDEKSGKPLPQSLVNLSLGDMITFEEFTDSNGVIRIEVKRHMNYQLRIEKQGYAPRNLTVKTQSIKGKSNIPMKVWLKPSPKPIITEIKIRGRVIDQLSKAALNQQKIVLESSTGKRYENVSDAEGMFYYAVASNERYDLMVYSGDEIIHRQALGDLSKKDTLHDVIVELKRPVATTLVFEKNKTDITKEHLTEIEKLQNLLRSNPSLSLQVEAHADNKESSSMSLSVTRMNQVIRALSINGIDESKISGLAYGAEKLENDCRYQACTDAQRLANQRVVINVVRGKK